MSSDLPPREKLLAYVGAHFDYIASHPLYPRIAQGEMMRAARGKRAATAAHREAILRSAVPQGGGGDSRRARRREISGRSILMHFVPSMIAIIVFHFTNAPVLRMVGKIDPSAPELVAARRAAVLDFISAALFRQQASSEGERN